MGDSSTPDDKDGAIQSVSASDTSMGWTEIKGGFSRIVSQSLNNKKNMRSLSASAPSSSSPIKLLDHPWVTRTSSYVAGVASSAVTVAVNATEVITRNTIMAISRRDIVAKTSGGSGGDSATADDDELEAGDMERGEEAGEEASNLMDLMVAHVSPEPAVANDNDDYDNVQEDEEIETMERGEEMSDVVASNKKEEHAELHHHNCSHKDVEEASSPLSPPPRRLRGISSKSVALTIDDAPSQYTTDILDILKAHGCRATFFIIGDNIAKLPDGDAVLRRIVEEGHELGK